MVWALALHGGDGESPNDLPPERRKPREATLRRCLEIGVAALKAHKSALDVVELVVSLYLFTRLYVYIDNHEQIFLSV